MADTDWTPLFSWTFRGKRFSDGGVDLRDLRALAAFRSAIVHFAGELWKQENPEFQRLPKGFPSLIQIQFFGITKNCATLQVCRRVNSGTLSLGFEPPSRQDISNKLPRAADMANAVLNAVRAGKPPPPGIPGLVLRKFRLIGESIGPGESFDITVTEPPPHAPALRMPKAQPCLGFDNTGHAQAVQLIDLVAPSKTAAAEDDTHERLEVRLTGTATADDKPVLKSIVGSAILDPVTGELSRIKARVTAESRLTDGNPRANNVPMKPNSSPDAIASYVRSRLGDGVWSAIAKRMAESSPTEMTMTDINRFAESINATVIDVHVVLDNLIHGPVKFMERMFVKIDNNGEVLLSADEVADRLRDGLTGNAQEVREWETWAKSVKVVWRWMMRSETE